jgi:hypothetical protein
LWNKVCVPPTDRIINSRTFISAGKEGRSVGTHALTSLKADRKNVNGMKPTQAGVQVMSTLGPSSVTAEHRATWFNALRSRPSLQSSGGS